MKTIRCVECRKPRGTVEDGSPVVLFWCHTCKHYSPRDPTPGAEYDVLHCGKHDVRPLGEPEPFPLVPRDHPLGGCGNAYAQTRLRPNMALSARCAHCGITNYVNVDVEGVIMQRTGRDR